MNKEGGQGSRKKGVLDVWEVGGVGEVAQV